MPGVTDRMQGRPGPLRALFTPVDGASLAAFRICFGAAMVWQGWKYFRAGWIETFFVAPGFHFTYLGFGWVKALPGDGMYLHLGAMIVLAALAGLGLFYRIGALLHALAVAWWFLIEATQYNNHYYLECLLAFLLVFLPAHRVASLDARLWPWMRVRTVPLWSVWLLRAQIGIVYVYGGLAKFDPDWRTGVPMRVFLGELAGTTVGDLARSPAGGLLLAWGGMFLDLLVVPLLLWRRTRTVAFLAAGLFHLANAFLLRIGVFPWFMIAATLIYFEPDWPRRVAAFLRRRVPSAALAAGRPPASLRGRDRLVLAALGLYLTVQLLVPLRHHLYPGRVTWTEEGMKFSWHMMLRHKLSRTEFHVTTHDGESLPIELYVPLNAKQWTLMQEDPDLILQFAHHLAGEAEREGFPDVRVRARVLSSLNGRDPELLVDPELDLAAVRRDLYTATWIRPLREPLPPPSPYGGRLDSIPGVDDRDPP